MKGKKIISVLLCLMAMMPFVLVKAENTEYSLLDSEYVRLLGRGEAGNNARTFNWPNAGFEFEFSGTKAEVYVDKSSFDTTASEGNYFNVAVYNGDSLVRVDRIKLILGWNTIYEIKDGDPEVKKIMTVRSSEACRGTLTMSKLRCDGVPTATEPRERLIEFIGDSYTAGYGNSPGLSKTTYYCAQNTDNWNSYTGIVARHFGADNNVIAYQGKGLYANQSGEVYDNTMTEQFLYEDIIVDGNMSSINLSTGKQHKFYKYQPQVVTIWLGTNDWAKEVDVETFKTAYTDFLGVVRENYPDAHILNIALEDSQYLDTINTIVNDSSRGENNKYYMLVLDKFQSVNLGHPDIAEDERIANQIIDKINSIPFVWGNTLPGTDDTSLVSIRADYNTGKINVFGRTDKENDEVSVTVMKPGTDVSKITEKQNIVYISQTATNNSGEYEFEIETDKLSGEYTFYLNAVSEKSLTEKKFTFKNLIPTLEVLSDGKKVTKMSEITQELLVHLSGFDINDGVSGMLTVAQYKNNALLYVSAVDVSEDTQDFGTEVKYKFDVKDGVEAIKVFYVDVKTMTPFIGAFEIK